MKRQKRDRLERAQSQGYKAGLNGRSSEHCRINQWMLVHVGWEAGGTQETTNSPVCLSKPIK